MPTDAPEEAGAGQFDKSAKVPPPPLLRKLSSRSHEGMQRLDEGDGATSQRGSGRVLSSISARFGSSKSLDSSSVREEPEEDVGIQGRRPSQIELPQLPRRSGSMSIGQVVSSPDLGSPLDAEGSELVSPTPTDETPRTTDTRGFVHVGKKRRKWSVSPLFGMSTYGSSGGSIGTDAVQLKEGGGRVFWCCARWMCFCTLFFAFTATAWGLTVAGVLPGWVPRSPPPASTAPAPLVALGGTYGLAITARVDDPNDLLVLSSSPTRTGWLLRALAKEMAGTARLDSATIVRTETLDIAYNSSALTREDMARAAGDVAMMTCGQHSCLLDDDYHTPTAGRQLQVAHVTAASTMRLILSESGTPHGTPHPHTRTHAHAWSCCEPVCRPPLHVHHTQSSTHAHILCRMYGIRRDGDTQRQRNPIDGR